MNPDRNTQRLLEDVMTGSPDADLRRAVLGETLLLARRRRRVRRGRRAGAAVLALALVAVATWRALPSGSTTEIQPSPRAPLAYTPIESAPLPNQPQLPEAAPGVPYVTIRTQPTPAAQVVATAPAASAEFAIRTLPGVELVATTPFSGGFRTISDEELLALVAPYPAALIRVAPGREQLLFMNPGDEQIFQ